MYKGVRLECVYEHTKEVSLKMYRCTYTKKVVRLGYVYEHNRYHNLTNIVHG